MSGESGMLLSNLKFEIHDLKQLLNSRFVIWNNFKFEIFNLKSILNYHLPSAFCLLPSRSHVAGGGA